MRLSISAKIFIGFLAVLFTFCAVTTYGAVSMRRLGDELRLVSRGYLELRLGVSDLQTGHSNLLRVLVDQMGKPEGTAVRVPRFVKFAIDDARRSRLKQQMPQVVSDVTALQQLHSSPEEHMLLAQVQARLKKIAVQFRADEELFDEVYGRIGDAPLVLAGDPEATRVAADRLLRREQAIKRDLANLSAELRLRAQQAALRLEESENRAVWATLLASVLAMIVGVGVMVITTRAVRPLRRLAERAKEIARGDYTQRVDASSGDEIGALGREFNAMAQALEERELMLIRSERLAAVGKIAAQITHEVRNPLSSIGLNAEMLEDEIDRLAQTGDGVEAKALVRAIVKEVDRLAEITEEYLRFARLPRPKLEREDLRQIVESLLAFMRPELERRQISVEARLPVLPPVAADEHQLRQALLNLLRNAAEAMQPGGRLVVRAEAVNGDVALIISDTGQGIRPEHLAKIFDPFFSTKEGGTGLGLALTQQIVVEHGGRIDVASEPGQGTTFTVTLTPATQPG